MLSVCPICKGKGYRYRYGKREPCFHPDCKADRTGLSYEKYMAKNALAICHRRYARQETGVDNLELALRGCNNCGISPLEMREVTGLTLGQIRKLITGQQTLV